MNVLLLAPHPFYQERGTPIAVNLLLRALSARGDRVDLLTYHEGTDVAHPNVTIHRIRPPAGVRNVPPGFSWKKVLCDLRMIAPALRLARERRPRIVHAVEESVFIAMAIRRRTGIPYVFDMDSSMPQQLVEKQPALRPLASLFRSCERAAVRQAAAVVPVCDALADIARDHGARHITVLRDVSLLPPDGGGDGGADLRTELDVRGPCVMYIGNLEPYQGVGLLLDSFALVAAARPDATLVIVGGKAADIERYRAQAGALSIASRVRFAGPRPVSAMPSLFRMADVLASPRVKGNNTPMKIYSYLQSDRPVVATNLPTHTQVLTAAIARLAAPTPEAFASGLRELLDNPTQAAELAKRARAEANDKYSYPVFERTVRELYDWLDAHA